MFRLLIIGTLIALLSGCAGMFAGEYVKRPALDGQGNIIIDPLTKRIAMETVRTSRSVAMVDKGARAITAERAPAAPPHQQASCMTLAVDEVLQLKAAAQAEYLRSVSTCALTAVIASVVGTLPDVIARATGAPTNRDAEIMREVTKAVAHSEQGLTNRIRAIANPLAITLGVKAVADAQVKQSEALRDVGVSAAENGGSISVGSISTSQNPSAVGEGVAGEMGTATGSATASASKTGDTIVIGNRNAYATEQGGAFTDGAQGLRNGESATSAYNEDVNIDQQPIIDDQNAELNNQPANGGNSVF